MRIKKFVSLFVAMLIMVVVSGCAARGHRKTTIELFGNKFVYEDRVFPNHEGKNEYNSGFDPENIALLQWLTGKDTQTDVENNVVAEDGINPTPQPSDVPDH